MLQDDPVTVFNKNGVQSTWQVVDYGGAFFRAQGGSAAAFNGGMQGQGLQSHRHEILGKSVKNTYGIIIAATNGNGYNIYDSEPTGYTGGNETRPLNYTIRVWKRTS